MEYRQGEKKANGGRDEPLELEETNCCVEYTTATRSLMSARLVLLSESERKDESGITATKSEGRVFG